MFWPISGHKFLRHSRTKVDVGFVVDIGLRSTMVKLAEGPKGENQVDAAYVPGIMCQGLTVVKVGQDFFKVPTNVDRTVYVEASEVDFHNVLHHFTIFGKPDLNRWTCRCGS